MHVSRCRWWWCSKCQGVFEKEDLAMKMQLYGGSGDVTILGTRGCANCGSVYHVRDIYAGTHDVPKQYWGQLQQPVEIRDENEIQENAALLRVLVCQKCAERYLIGVDSAILNTDSVPDKDWVWERSFVDESAGDYDYVTRLDYKSIKPASAEFARAQCRTALQKADSDTKATWTCRACVHKQRYWESTERGETSRATSSSSSVSYSPDPDSYAGELDRLGCVRVLVAVLFALIGGPIVGGTIGYVLGRVFLPGMPGAAMAMAVIGGLVCTMFIAASYKYLAPLARLAQFVSDLRTTEEPNEAKEDEATGSDKARKRRKKKKSRAKE